MPCAICGLGLLVVGALCALGALGASDRFLSSLGALGRHVPQGQLEGRYRTVVIAVMIALASEGVAVAAVNAAAAAVSAVKGVAAETVAAAAVPTSQASAAAKEPIQATVSTPSVVAVQTTVASTSGKLATAALAGPASGQPGSPSTIVAAAFLIVVISVIRLRREIAS